MDYKPTSKEDIENIFKDHERVLKSRQVVVDPDAPAETRMMLEMINYIELYLTTYRKPIPYSAISRRFNKRAKTLFGSMDGAKTKLIQEYGYREFVTYKKKRIFLITPEQLEYLKFDMKGHMYDFLDFLDTL